MVCERTGEELRERKRECGDGGKGMILKTNTDVGTFSSLACRKQAFSSFNRRIFVDQLFVVFHGVAEVPDNS